MLTYHQTPIQQIHDPTLANAGVELQLKREDLNHPQISGNKWWKLKYNLLEAVQQQQKTLLTFGGAFSNHIYATAAAAREAGIQSIGIIRGEQTNPLNPTLRFAQDNGMQLHYISRETYRDKKHDEFVHQLHQQFGDFYLVPEGGTNSFALRGCIEFATTLPAAAFNYITLPVGTGGTIAGIIQGASSGQIIGFSALKGGPFLEEEIKMLLKPESPKRPWNINDSYHFGGYAKKNDALIAFIQSFYSKNNIPLDFVYTAKMMWGIYDLIRQGYFPRGSKILAIHTGGLQGNGNILTY